MTYHGWLEVCICVLKENGLHTGWSYDEKIEPTVHLRLVFFHTFHNNHCC